MPLWIFGLLLPLHIGSADIVIQKHVEEVRLNAGSQVLSADCNITDQLRQTRIKVSCLQSPTKLFLKPKQSDC